MNHRSEKLKGTIMRNLLLLGTASLALLLGVASASAQSYQERPSSSPYAVINQQQSNPLSVLTEGRSAFVGEASEFTARSRNGSIRNAAPVTQDLNAFPAQ
jgi:hypothetical protein